MTPPVPVLALRPPQDAQGHNLVRTGLEENVARVREALDERAWNQLKHFAGRMKEWYTSWDTSVQIVGVWADVDWTLTQPDRFENQISPSLADSLVWILNHQGQVGAITGSPYRAVDLLNPSLHLPASVDERLVGAIRKRLIAPSDIQRLRVLARSGGYDVHFSTDGKEEIKTSPLRFVSPEQLEISRRLAIAVLHAIERKTNARLSQEIIHLEQTWNYRAIAEILRDVEKAHNLLLFPEITPLEVDDTMIFVTFKDHALDPAEILAEARPAIGPTAGVGSRIDFIQGPMYVAVSLLKKSETLARSMHEQGTKTGLFIVAGDGPRDDLPMLVQAANSKWLVLPLFVGSPEAVGTTDPIVVPHRGRFVEAADRFLAQAVNAARDGKPYADLPFIAGEITPSEVAKALGIPLIKFSDTILSLSYAQAQARLAAGLEEGESGNDWELDAEGEAGRLQGAREHLDTHPPIQREPSQTQEEWETGWQRWWEGFGRVLPDLVPTLEVGDGEDRLNLFRLFAELPTPVRRVDTYRAVRGFLLEAWEDDQPQVRDFVRGYWRRLEQDAWELLNERMRRLLKGKRYLVEYSAGFIEGVDALALAEMEAIFMTNAKKLGGEIDFAQYDPRYANIDPEVRRVTLLAPEDLTSFLPNSSRHRAIAARWSHQKDQTRLLTRAFLLAMAVASIPESPAEDDPALVALQGYFRALGMWVNAQQLQGLLSSGAQDVEVWLKTLRALTVNLGVAPLRPLLDERISDFWKELVTGLFA